LWRRPLLGRERPPTIIEGATIGSISATSLTKLDAIFINPLLALPMNALDS